MEMGRKEVFIQTYLKLKPTWLSDGKAQLSAHPVQIEYSVECYW